MFNSAPENGAKDEALSGCLFGKKKTPPLPGRYLGLANLGSMSAMALRVPV